ncbi:sec-independent protein translocase protein TatC [Parabacteroides sp. PF5-5]|uniref:twin-arginine translocase subunit TatC n=1 Tax=unclassified Parabacteroides TaxID=2649774 RepID=UPI002473707C|nr:MULTISPECIES: twin-arginine translocase subunit TatC [unclassified Parabacteroides]MDH6305792.1 sec-independent protein translocase protein TatC [Parabacteroides sp. PH5-39]MDH6317771.1 sec-independent protein translocase protein TatC [Parabacteroides sp. PF5-13]MDH6320602.1 sec-independent protein translocase protein TatC [Parabacteroides sp. PH5-13]MDH6324235.1 sec-independent protein translocase protein TatC [Parabacteroides sp. PH5-8]MDH6328956.1 sec-independent protein translocase prot
MEQNEMSFWDHLEDLRWTIFRSLAALFIFMIGLFAFMRGEYGIFDGVIMAPTKGDFITYQLFCKAASFFGVVSDFCDTSFRIHIFNIKLASQFFTHMTTSFWLALVLTFPYLMYEVWKFIRPALYDNEKRSVAWVFLFGTGMFFVGCAVGYFMVFPVTLRFLATYQISEAITEQVSLESYMDNFLMLIFIMGIMFEMPLLSWLLSQLGLVNRSLFHKYRRHAVVGLLVLAAFITPSGDPFTLMIVFIPLYFLFELSAFFVKPAPPEDEDDEDEYLPEVANN